MPKPYHVIYIPGLGDRAIRNLGQAYIIRLWQHKFHIKADYHIVGWADPQGDFDKKLLRLLGQIDNWTSKGQRVSIVASSAGASMALHAYAKRKSKIGALVLIAPALGEVKSVDPHIFAINPSFKTSLEHLPTTLAALTPTDRNNILIVKPKSDKVVRLQDMNLDNSRYLHLPTKGHLWTIVAALTFYNRKLMAFIRAT